MEKERSIFCQIIIDYFKHSHFIGNLENLKSAEASAEARKKGNDLLLKQKRHDAEMHKEIFSHYCESIALAPMESQELALAYGNRSYLLLHMHKYEECIEDIDRALAFSIPDVLKAKLLCRKAECRKRLGSPSISSILKMVQIVAENGDGQDKLKILKMIDAVNALDVGIKKEGMSKSDKKREADYNLPVTDDYSSCVSIEYSEKYGRHLVAAKDYQPGDIIFIEKIHASDFVEGSSLLGCDYCLKHTWSSIPCSCCNWAMYCSESCREKAWNEYHDIECTVISYLKKWLELSWKLAVLPLRILIMGIKETGGLANLKKEIELLEQCTGDSSRDLSKNGQIPIKSIRDVCSLDSPLDFCHCDLMKRATVVPYILTGLTEYSELKDDFNLKGVEKEFMFLGKVLVKLMAVLDYNAFVATYDLSEFNTKSNFGVKRCFGIVFSLLNRSCFPSANWCCTESNKVVVYAAQPIKKGSQIFVLFRNGFEHEPQSARQAAFKEKYNFTCECRACVENWDPVHMAEYCNENAKKADFEKNIASDDFLFENLKEVIRVLKGGRQADQLHIQKLSALITRAMHWRQPSYMLCKLITFLNDIFDYMYSPSPLIFNDCN